MSKIPPPINTIQAAIDAHHESHQEPPRPHLGCSQLGHPCDRWLWLSFRWAVVERFSGRMLRLFRRGQLEEQQIVNDLRAIGIDVQSTGTEQSRVDFGSHVSGSIDGIAVNGVPGARKPHILEFKTHSLKSFGDLIKTQSVENSKPQHYAQMQLYMLGKGIDRALYVAVCKDNDAIYTERVKFVPEVAEKLLERGKRIALAERMPEPLSTDPTWYQCKFCAAHDFCHVSHMTQQVNCRTCAHVTPETDSTWSCARHNDGGIPVDFQRTGCDCHVLHPDLVPWKMLDSGDPHAALYEIDGKPIRNGQPDQETFASSELVANASACASDDAVIHDMRAMFGAKVEG